MPGQGHPSVGRTHLGIGWARDRTRWSLQLRSWWTAHHAARQAATLASLSTCWDATREAVIPFRADAAPELAAAHGARSVVMLLYSLTL